MKAAELRIGNYYYLIEKDVNPLDIFIVSDGHSLSLIEEKDNAQPIPLTEEWLIKFGFKKEIAWFRKDKHAVNLLIAGLYEFKNIPIKEISYIHELQNLYFALTGEELVVNVK